MGSWGMIPSIPSMISSASSAQEETAKTAMTTSPVKAQAFIALIIVLGLCVLGNAVVSAHALTFAVRFIAFLLVACLAARLKVKLPGVTGSMSVNLPFILVAVAEMGQLEALLIACLSSLTQCLPRDRRKFNWLQTSFNVCAMALAVEATRLVYGASFLRDHVASRPPRLASACP